MLLVKTREWFPSIDAIRKACFEISGQRAKLPSVGEAYAEARRKASALGSYVKPVSEDFSHAIVHRAALQSSGSWRRWCLTDDEAEAPLRARFFQVYGELCDREITQRALPESARQLTAEESHQLLADVATKGGVEPKRLSGGEALKPISELIRSRPLFKGREVVGRDMTEAEWEARKSAVRRGDAG